MPSTISMAAFVLGAVLLLVSLTDGSVKLFAAEVSGTSSILARFASGAFGLAFIALGLWLALKADVPKPAMVPSGGPAGGSLTTDHGNNGSTGGTPITSDHPQPPVHTTGTIVIRGTWSCDLDQGLETTSGADFWWEQKTATQRALTPKNGAQFQIVGIRDSLNDVTFADLQAYHYSPQPIDASDATYNQMPQGCVVAYKTSEGRFGKFRVEQYGYNLRIQWVTYETPH